MTIEMGFLQEANGRLKSEKEKHFNSLEELRAQNIQLHEKVQELSVELTSSNLNCSRAFASVENSKKQLSDTKLQIDKLELENQLLESQVKNSSSDIALKNVQFNELQEKAASSIRDMEEKSKHLIQQHKVKEQKQQDEVDYLQSRWERRDQYLHTKQAELHEQIKNLQKQNENMFQEIHSFVEVSKEQNEKSMKKIFDGLKTITKTCPVTITFLNWAGNRGVERSPVISEPPVNIGAESQKTAEQSNLPSVPSEISGGVKPGSCQGDVSVLSEDKEIQVCESVVTCSEDFPVSPETENLEKSLPSTSGTEQLSASRTSLFRQKKRPELEEPGIGKERIIKEKTKKRKV